MESRRIFLGHLAAGAALVAWRPSWAGVSDAPMCRVVRPGDPDYDSARTDFNLRFDIRPRAILFACNTDDVVQGVRWARDQGVELRARAGGHSYEGFSLVEDGLVIDTTPIAHVKVSPDGRRARIGAGIRLGDAYRTLWASGHLAIPSGSCGTVGLAGITLGGGFGVLSRRRGLTCDALVEAEIVTADGNVVRASDTENSDLFWALRGGGGGNFGIVTELTFRVESVGDLAVTFVHWPWEQLAEMLDAWQRSAPGIDRRLFLGAYFPKPSESPAVGAFFDGTPDELQQLMEPLLKVGTPTVDVPPVAVSWGNIVGSADGFQNGADITGVPAKFKASSAYISNLLPAEAIASLAQNLRSAPGSASNLNFVQFDNLGGAVGDIAPDATAFFHRRSLASLQFYADWTDDADQKAQIGWIDAIRNAMLPWTDGAYINYIDRNIPDWPAQYYGDNFDRLRLVKTVWDPANVFHFPQSIPPL